MLVVVDFHGRGVNVRLEGAFVVRQWGQHIFALRGVPTRESGRRLCWRTSRLREGGRCDQTQSSGGDGLSTIHGWAPVAYDGPWPNSTESGDHPPRREESDAHP